MEKSNLEKSKLYTKTGDRGETSLVSGKRLSKSDERISLYGELDELNSQVGVIVSYLKKSDFTLKAEILDLFQRIQSDLFCLGSLFACEVENWEKFKLKQIQLEDVKRIEPAIDLYASTLPKLKNFVLPGGAIASAHTHVARTVCRRVERQAVAFSKNNTLPDNSMLYLNRFSDFLFVIARYINLEFNEAEILWTE